MRRVLIVAALVSAAVSHGSSADQEPVPHALSPLILTGSLRAENAERFSVPLTDNWNVQLKWMVEEGTGVDVDEVIARFDPGTMQQSLQEDLEQLEAKRQEYRLKQLEGQLTIMEKQGALAAAEAEYEKAKLDAAVPEGVLNGKDFRERQLNLMRKKKELDDAHLALSSQKVEHAVTLASIDLDIGDLKESIARAEKELSMLEVRATAPGIVVHEEHPWWGRKVRVGDNLQATFPLARIPDLDSLQVEAWVGESDVWQLGPGDRMGVSLDAFPGRKYTGRVTSVARAGEKRELWGRSPYFKVIIELDELDDDMRPGMSARCVMLERGVQLAGSE